MNCLTSSHLYAFEYSWMEGEGPLSFVYCHIVVQLYESMTKSEIQQGCVKATEPVAFTQPCCIDLSNYQIIYLSNYWIFQIK